MLLFFMAILGTFIGIIVLILMVFYIEDVYQETKYLASQFQHAEQKIEKVVPFMPTEQAPILKVRKKEYEEDYLKAKYFGIATHYCLEMMNDFSVDNLNYSLNLLKKEFFIFFLLV